MLFLFLLKLDLRRHFGLILLDCSSSNSNNTNKIEKRS